MKTKVKQIIMAVIVAMSLITMSQKSSAQVFLLGDSESIRSANNGSWGNLGNVTPDDGNGAGNGSWGDFDMEDPYAPVGEGIVLLTLSGLGYAALKRKKSKSNSDSVVDRL